MAVATAPEVSSIAADLHFREEQVHNLVALLDEGCTIPFITRYRKDETGGLDEEQIRAAAKRLEQHRLLAQRKETILRSIDSQGKLTPELRAAIEDAGSIKRLEDLYLPYKPKKQTLASLARERGLGPLAEEIRSGECKDADARAADFINPDKQIKTAADALLGAGHILAEGFSELADLRQKLREVLERNGKLVTQRAAESKAEVDKEKPNAKQPAQPAADSSVQSSSTPAEPAAVSEETAAQSAPAEAPAEGTGSSAESASAQPAAEQQAEAPASAESTVFEAAVDTPEAPTAEEANAPSAATTAPSPAAETPAPATSATEPPTPENSATETPATESPSTESPATETPAPAPPTAEAPTPAAAAQTSAAKPAPAAAKQTKPKKKKEKKKKQDDKLVRTFQDFFDFSERLTKLPPHRILAINRGERAKVLRVKVDADFDAMHRLVDEAACADDHPHAEFLRGCARDALNRLIFPGLDREARRELTEFAEWHAVDVFARNLRSLLLRPPVAGRRVLAIDPGFRSGCKIVAIDEFGAFVENSIVYVTGKGNRRISARLKLAEFVKKHNLSVVVIGNGTACRETEALIAELIAGPAESELRGPEEEAAENKIAETKAAENKAAEEKPPETKVAENTADAKPPADGVATAAPPTEPAADASTTLDVASETNPASEAAAPASAETKPPASSADKPEDKPAENSAEETANAATPEDGASSPAAQTAAAQAVAAETASAPVANKTEPRKQTVKQPGAPRKLSREEFDLLNDETVRGVSYTIVNEAGASVYSTSTVGREEFPNLDATIRGAVSIGRRLQDPLSELVKIEPGAIGVGMYQHDVKARHLQSSLDDVVESCVNFVGVDVNTASVSLLRYVSGLNQLTARRLFEFRGEQGPLKNREQLKQITGLGEAAFVQAAGFLRIADGENVLDGTWIHPEHYDAAARLLEKLGCSLESLRDKASLAALADKLKQVDVPAMAEELNLGQLTLRDILQQIVKPGRDPREDLPPPIFRREILKLEDLKPGMELSGSVLNVVDFGVFIDIGLKDSGLVHISRISNGYVASPHDMVAVGDIVKVWVVEVDGQRHRVSLTMIEPGTERAQRPPRGRSKNSQEQSQAEGRPARGNQRGGDRSGGGQSRGGQSRGGQARSGQARGGRPQGRGQQGRGRKGGRPQPYQGQPRVFEKKSGKAPAKLSDKMKKGKEPLRTFGQLQQFSQIKDENEIEKDQNISDKNMKDNDIKDKNIQDNDTKGNDIQDNDKDQSS